MLLGDSRGRTSIHLAAARGHASWLGELLSIACSEPPSLPPLRDHSGYTPLHWACYYGRATHPHPCYQDGERSSHGPCVCVCRS